MANVAVLFLYSPQGKVLLQHRTAYKKRWANYWGSFGGGIEEGETPENAMIREVLEETGYRVHEHTFLITQKLGDDEKHVFVASYDDLQTIILNPEESQGMGWFGREDIETLEIIPHDKEVALKVFKYLKFPGMTFEKERASKFRLLAAIDMEEVIEAVSLLKKFFTKEFSWPPGRIHQLKKAIETAVVVSYARPFASSHYTNRLTDIDVAHLGQDLRILHNELLELRNSRYAHTDVQEKSMRNAEIIGKKDIEGYGFIESWVALDQEKLNLIVSLCTLNRDKWRANELANREDGL